MDSNQEPVSLNDLRALAKRPELRVFDRQTRSRRGRSSGDFTPFGAIVGNVARSPETFTEAQAPDPEMSQDDWKKRRNAREEARRKREEAREAAKAAVRPAIGFPRQHTSETCRLCKCTIDINDRAETHGFLRDDFGRLVPCPECSPAVIRARARRKADADIKALVHGSKFRDMQNLPIDASDYSLADYPGQPEYITAIEKFISGETKEMILIGDVGRGKTGLAISAVHECWKKGAQVLFLPMEQYLDLLKENFRDGAQENHIKRVAASVDILVIDDIGAGQITDSGFVVKETQSLIENRHASGLRTLITSNMTIDGLGGFYYMRSYERAGFQPGQRVISRLKGWYKVVEIKGADLRQGE